MYNPKFTISPRAVWLVSDISRKLTEIETGRKLPSPMLRRANRIRSIHSSLAIENNTLTVGQVTDIIDGRRVLGDPREIQEVKNAIRCYEALESIDVTDVDDLLRMHGIMMRYLLDDAGEFRTSEVGVFAGRRLVHLGSSPEDVPMLVGGLLEWLATTDHHPLIASCVFHYEFETIHPFSDGNGRMGRLWQTAILASWMPEMAWIPMESAVLQHRQRYYDALTDSRTGDDSGPFIDFMLESIDRALDGSADDHPYPVEETDGLSRIESSVLGMIRQGAFTSNSAAAGVLSVSERTVARAIKVLREGGFIERVGSPRSGHWKAVDQD